MIQETFEQSEFLDNMDYDVEKETKIYNRKKKKLEYRIECSYMKEVLKPIKKIHTSIHFVWKDFNLESGNVGSLSHGRISRTDTLDDNVGKVMTSVDTTSRILNTLSIQTHETTTETITSTIGVNDFTGINLDDGISVSNITLSSDSRFSALSNNDKTRLGVTLLELRQLLGNLLNVISVPTGLLRVSTSLIFVTKENVSVLDDGIKTLLEELRQERSTQVESKGLVVLSSMLRNQKSRLVTTIMSDEETTHVVVVGFFNELPVLRLLEERSLELFSSGQVSNERTIK